ncbi:MAG: 5-formyltetrahydrofolate cyclo-ligase [Candidatus Gastranaerophilaceae bacterium]|jgi:5-formyltetrahydrofolate cyclo-ligase
MNKTILRTNAKIIRKFANIVEISQEICKNISCWELFQKSKNIFAYYPFKNELDLKALFELKNKNWYLPRVMDDSINLSFHDYKSGDLLFANKWGILEPSKSLSKIDFSIVDMILIPALMVDKKGHRLGYGAGFYDKFLIKLPPKCIKVVPVIQDLFVENLPADNWDVPVDYVITQEKILKI